VPARAGRAPPSICVGSVSRVGAKSRSGAPPAFSLPLLAMALLLS
jgi:hypothetical protein